MALHGDRCLPGRKRQFARGVYSALAGFVEPGETIEDACRRELHEEAGITVAKVYYHASQPWPFPAMVMIGLMADAISETITLHDEELQEARWLTRDEVRLMLAGHHRDDLHPPNPISMARHLMEGFARA
ncbi:MAG: NAD(+) diphosphatase [Hyphomicrobiales bacterium]